MARSRGPQSRQTPARAKYHYAIYHCEQAAEKVIKAVLISEGVHANIKHQLDDMVEQVPDANPLKPLLKQLEHLAAYATTYRYAMPSGRIKSAPNEATLENDIASVDAALSAAATAFGVDLSKQDQPAKTAKPVR